VRGIDWSPGRYGLGIAIGNLFVTLEELAGAYALLANGGRRVGLTRLASVAEVQRSAGSPAEQLLPAEVAALVSHVLADPLARRPAFTPGGPLDFEGAVAVKTGTSQGHRDAWAVAYDERLLVAVWVGNHDWRTTNGLTGASAAAPIAHGVFEEIQALRPQLRPAGERSAWPLPPTVVRRTVCALSGALAEPDCPQRQEELFRAGSEPVETCTVHRRVRIDRRNGLRAGSGCDRRFVAEWPMIDLPPEYGPWARAAHLEVAPKAESPLCPSREPEPGPAKVRILSPRPPARILLDPETPPALATLKLAARVTPAEEEIVWLVDDAPVARVGWPHEARWRLVAGRHVIRAVALRGGQSAPVTVTVE
jgi:penicillin-binding protein 1C